MVDIRYSHAWSGVSRWRTPTADGLHTVHKTIYSTAFYIDIQLELDDMSMIGLEGPIRAWVMPILTVLKHDSN